MRIAVNAVALVLVAGCGFERDVPPQPSRQIPDKAELFGDPALVPTRVGERARFELAQAGEVQRALELLAEVEAAHVTSEGVPTRRMTITARTPPDVSVQAAEAAIDRVLAGIAGAEVARRSTVVASAARAHPEVPQPLAPLLGVALLGLGFSAGIAFERARRR